MLKKTLSSIFVCLLFAFNTLAQTSKVDSSEMVTLRIDPDAARGAAVSQIFEEVKFIPLETTKESLFGSINQLDITKDRFIIFDKDTRSVLIFDKTGKYINKLSTNKLERSDNLKEELEINGFRLKDENDKTYIAVASKKSVVYFNLDGKFVKKSILKKDEYFLADYKFADTTNKLIERFLEINGKDSSYFDVALLRKNKVVAKYLPFNKKRFRDQEFHGNDPTTYNPDNNEILLFKNYDIYRAKPTSLSLVYKIIFPAGYSLPKDFATNPIYINKRIDYYQNNKNTFYAMSNGYQIGNKLFFKTHCWGCSNDKKTAFIYNLKTTELLSVGNIEPDSSSYFLPITDSNFHFDFSNNGFYKYTDGFLYTSYSSLAMFTFKEQSAGKTQKYSEVLKHYFESENKKSNPVIIQLKPKKD